MIEKDRVAAITGATGNLGSVVARSLAGQGARLALFSTNPQRLERLASELSLPAGRLLTAPFDFTQKRMGENDFTKIPNGIPSLEDRINLYFTHGVKSSKIDIQRFVETASTQAAKLFGLYPRKGAIQVGSDADLVVYDPNYRGKISAKTHQMNLDYNSFEGFAIEGRPHVVTVRGKIAARDGKFVGEVGRGKFLKREPSHF